MPASTLVSSERRRIRADHWTRHSLSRRRCKAVQQYFEAVWTTQRRRPKWWLARASRCWTSKSKNTPELVPVYEANWELFSSWQDGSQGRLQLNARVRLQLEVLHHLYRQKQVNGSNESQNFCSQVSMIFCP